jgi:hemoglobin/transferrin/lactoferrin receptor protein
MILKHYLIIAPLLATGLTAVAATESTENKPVTHTHLAEVTIAANRDSVARINSPRQLITFPTAEIDFLNCRSMAELLSETGRIAVQKSQQGGGSPMLRGFEAARVLLVTDGIRMNNLIYRNGHLQNCITVDQYMVDNVEAVTGPSSLLYGSDALGGTILFNTRQPKLSTTGGTAVNGNAILRYGSVNEEGTAHLDLNIGSKKFASLTSFTYSHFGDLKAGQTRNPFLPKDDQYITCAGYVIPGSDGNDQFIESDKPYLQSRSSYMQYDLMQKFLFQPSAGEQHILDFQLSNTNDFNRYDRLAAMSEKNGVTTPKYAEWYYGPQFRLMADYHYTGENKLGADLVKAIVAYQRTKESRHNRKFNDPLLYHNWEAVDMLTINTDWIKAVNAHKLHAGVDLAFSFLRSTAETENLATGETADYTTRYPDGDNRMHTAEAFLTHEWRINPQWTMTDGVRLGYASVYSSVKDVANFPFFGNKNSMSRDNFTYSLAWGMNYLPNHSWKFAFSAETAYRVPNIDNTSKVFDSKLATVTIPNPDLKPEQTVSADLNITKYIGDKLVFENVLFCTYLFDAITTGRGTLNGSDKMEYQGVDCDVYTSLNREKAFIWGYSGMLTYKASRNVQLDASFTYTHGRIVSGDVHAPLDHIPPMYGRFGVSWLSNDSKLRFDFYAIYNSHKSIDDYNMDGEDNIDYATVKGADGEGIPAWYTLNLKGSWQITKQLKVQAGVENILDTEYRTFASGINAPGRNIYAALHVAF